MKLSLSKSLIILVLVSLSACSVIAQQGASVAVLKDQIAHLEKMSRSVDTPAAMKASSLRLLAEKRAQLRASLQMQIDSLRKYQAAYGGRFTAQEHQGVNNSIQTLEWDLQKLKTGPDLAEPVRSPLQEKGHAGNRQRDIHTASKTNTRSAREKVQLISTNEPGFQPRRMEDEYLAPNSSASSGPSVAISTIPVSATTNANPAPPRAARRMANALAANPADPPASSSIPVYWRSSRHIACPPKVTEKTTINFQLREINDLLIDFDRNRRATYQLTTKRYAMSQTPPELPGYFTSGGQKFRPRTTDPSCSITNTNELLQKLGVIRSRVQSTAAISPDAEGGKSYPRSETRDAALGIREVRCVLASVANNSSLVDAEVQLDPVFQWLQRVNATTAPTVDLFVELEPDSNYDFKIEELWGGSVTEGGTLKANCGERDLFTLSIGPMVSMLPSRSYIHQTVPVAGTSTTQSVLEVENQRNINILGAALLNYHLPRFHWLPSETGLALSAGPVYTLGGTPEVSALGLFVGMSAHLNRSIFITPGVHIGEFADFPTGFAPGSVIPTGFGNLNPVKRRTAKFAIGLTYKTTSFKKSNGNGDKPTPPATPNENEEEEDEEPSGNQNGPSTPGTQGGGTPNPPARPAPTLVTPVQPTPAPVTPAPVTPVQPRPTPVTPAQTRPRTGPRPTPRP